MVNTRLKISRIAGTSALISCGVYLGIIAVCMLTGEFSEPDSTQRGLAFDELYFDYSGLPALEHYTAKDGTQLSYRYYPSDSDTIVVLLHGAAWHSRYFLPLAAFLSSNGLAKVFTPDLRGHGTSPRRRGDVDYIGQFEDDLADFIAVIKKDNPKSTLIMGGHSSGGGLAVRFAGSTHGKKADAYLLFAPYLKYNAPTTRPNSGGFAMPNRGHIIGLSMLNNVGIRWFNDLKVIKFNMHKRARDGTETLSYSYRLMTAYAPHNYKVDLSAITQPLLVIAGTNDKTMIAKKYEPVISKYTKATVKLVKGLSHFGVVVSPKVQPVIKRWLQAM